MSILAEPSTTLSGEAWSHPKITPFRLAFIFTTGGLEIVKAILVSKGSIASSITIEWITGVIVALTFQFLGSCEYNDARPRCLDWLFCYDCLGTLGTEIVASHPASDAPELPNSWSTMDSPELPDNPVILTGYRLLVATICAAFGLAKMLCSYLGLSSAMSALDWTIAIPLTLGLYCFGLYEDSRARPLRKVFEVDYSNQITSTSQIALYVSVWSIGVALCFYWLIYWIGAMRGTIAYSIPVQSHDGIETVDVWSQVFLRATQMFEVSIDLMMLSAGVLGLNVLLWPFIKRVYGDNFENFIRFGGIGVGIAAIILTGLLFIAFFLAVLATILG